jgi:hypothetical protein
MNYGNETDQLTLNSSLKLYTYVELELVKKQNRKGYEFISMLFTILEKRKYDI